MQKEAIVYQCSWCHPPESEHHNPKASHGICADHLMEKCKPAYNNLIDSVKPFAATLGMTAHDYLNMKYTGCAHGPH